MKLISHIILIVFLFSCDNKTSDYYYNLACDEEAKGNWTNAINYLDKALEINPQDIQALNNRGYDYLELKNYNNAQADFEKMIELDQYCPGAYYAIGYLNFEVKNYDKAILYFDKAIKLKGGGPAFIEHVNNQYTKSPYSMDVPIEKINKYKTLAEIEINKQQADTLSVHN